jgi:hypothetical protein
VPVNHSVGLITSIVFEYRVSKYFHIALVVFDYEKINGTVLKIDIQNHCLLENKSSMCLLTYSLTLRMLLIFSLALVTSMNTACFMT